MCELCIDTDVICEAAELQLCLLFVQVGQLLVALDGPFLFNVTVSHDAADISFLTRACAGVTLAPGPHPALGVSVRGAPGPMVPYPGARVVQVILKLICSMLFDGY